MTVFNSSKDDVLNTSLNIRSGSLYYNDDGSGVLRPPFYTTAQRDGITAEEGAVIYNSSTNKLNFYNGSAWEVVTSS